MEYLFIISILVVAFFYSSVGHGGASGYLALMALYGVSAGLMKPMALLMNIVVSLVAFIHYSRAGYFSWKLFLPFAVASVPAAFFGSWVTPELHIYRKILGILLLFPALRLFGWLNMEQFTTKRPPYSWALISGALIGFVSGMIGIGGGIVLSPLILLMRWATIKETAALSALFIFVNSISAFAGLSAKGFDLHSLQYSWLLTALAGGLAGSYLGSMKWNQHVLRKALAFVLLLASFKLITL